MKREYDVEVTRENRWWMIHVPAIDGLTQARRIGEVEDMARSLIAVTTDTPVTDISVRVVSITVPEHGDIAAEAAHVRTLRTQAAAADLAAAAGSSSYARQLTKAGVPVRDIAELLDISPQRVSQLANS